MTVKVSYTKGEKMKVEICFDTDPIGINLTAENASDKVIIERFWNGGVKVNSVTGSFAELQLTFKDLIKTKNPEYGLMELTANLDGRTKRLTNFINSHMYDSASKEVDVVLEIVNKIKETMLNP